MKLSFQPDVTPREKPREAGGLVTRHSSKRSTVLKFITNRKRHCAIACDCASAADAAAEASFHQCFFLQKDAFRGGKRKVGQSFLIVV